MKVLCADDDPVARTALAAHLSRRGFEVIEVACGDEAWQAVQDHEIRLVITDWAMPGIDGVGLIERIRKSRSTPRVYVILLTARNSDEDIAAGLDAGADDYLSKPVRAKELRARVDIGVRMLDTLELVEKSMRELRRISSLDDLTGLYNRRRFQELGQREVDRARRYGSGLAAVLFDLDRFKRINDSHGHAVGDDVLREVGRRLQSLRTSDLSARYGGEEFAVLLSNVGIEDARVAAERMRRLIGGTPMPTRAGPIHVSASFGIAVFDPLAPWLDTLLRRADAALYRAKRAGRDRVAA